MKKLLLLAVFIMMGCGDVDTTIVVPGATEIIITPESVLLIYPDGHQEEFVLPVMVKCEKGDKDDKDDKKRRDD